MSENAERTLNDLLSAYLDGELGAQARAEVEAHLQQDAQARQLLADLRETRSLLQDLPHTSAPAGFAEEVLRATRQRAPGQRPRARHWRLGPWRAAAAIVLLVGAGGSWILWQYNAEDVRVAFSPTAATPRLPAERDELAAAPEEDSSGDYEVYADARKRGPENGLKAGLSGKKAGPVEFKSAGKAAGAKEGNRGQFAQAPAAMKKKSAKGESPSHLGQVAEVSAPRQQIQVLADLDEEMEAAEPNIPVVDGSEATLVLDALAMGDISTPELGNELLEQIEGYPFGSESVELTLDFPDADRRDEFQQWTNSYFSANSFQEVNDLAGQSQSLVPSEGNLYMPGYRGVNFQDAEGIQSVVNAPPEFLNGLIDQYAATVQDWNGQPAIELTVGQTKASGVETTKALATLLTQAQTQRVVMDAPDEEVFAFAAARLSEDEAPTLAGVDVAFLPSASSGPAREESQVRVAEKTAPEGEGPRSRSRADRIVGQVIAPTDSADEEEEVGAAKEDKDGGGVQRRKARRARRGIRQPDDRRVATSAGDRAGNRAIMGRQAVLSARNITFVLNLRTQGVSAKQALVSPDEATTPATRPAAEQEKSENIAE